MLRRLRGRARLAVVGGLVLGLVIATTALYAVVLPSQALGAQATLTILSGTVEVRDAGATSFTAGNDLGVVGPGATLRTGSDGNALLTFFDGSTVTVEPATELTLEQLETTGAGGSLISIVQVVGRTWHVVGRTLPPGSVYSVRTTSATAVVRGTAFDFSVDELGGATALTEEGTVALTAQGQTVEVGAEQIAEAPANAPPTQPEPAPPPDNLVKVIIDPTNSAAAVDSKGRAVAIINGVPSITVPRGRVEFIDGKIILTVPTGATERVSTVVKTDDPTKAVAIQTQVEAKGVIVGNTLEVRAPDETGTAKGGIAVTSNGVIVLPDAEAKQFGLPKIAPPPPVTGGGGLFGAAPAFPGVTALPNLPNFPTFTFAPGATPPTTFALPEGVTLPADVRVGEFKGGFQTFSFFGFTQNITKQPGFDPTKAAGLEFAANGVAAAPRSFNYATFNGALPPGVVPPPPPGATGLQSAAGFAPPPGFSFRPIEVPASGAAGGASAPPFDSSTIPSFNLPPEVQAQMAQQLAQFQQIATRLQQQGAFSAPAGAPTAPGGPGTTGAQGNPLTGGGFPTLPISPFASPGAPQGGVGPSPFRGPQGQLPEGCRDLGIFGVSCDNVAPIAAPGGAPGSFPPGVPFSGSFPPGGSFPAGAPFGGSPPPGFAGSPPPGGFPTLPACAPGQLPSPTNPCAQTGGGTPTCPPGTIGTSPECRPITTTGGAVPTCPPGTTGVSPNCVGTAPASGGAFPTCPPGTVPIGAGQCAGTSTSAPTATFPTTTFRTCVAPEVLLPDGRCGLPPTTGSFTPFPSPSGTFTTGTFTPFPSPTSGTTKCSDGSDPVNGVCPTPPPPASPSEPTPAPTFSAAPPPPPAPTSSAAPSPTSPTPP